MPLLTGTAANRTRYSMNALEHDYATHLDALRAAGAIVAWWFEAERLKIGVAAERRDAFYTPDFRVQLPDGTIEFHETKGHWREAAKVRIRAAAAQHPYVFRGVTRDRKTKLWTYELFTPGAPNWLGDWTEET